MKNGGWRACSIKVGLKNPCEHAIKDHYDIMRWLNATDQDAETWALQRRIFSSFKFRVSCEGKPNFDVELIEPLASILRDTRGVCKEFVHADLGSTDFLVLGRRAFFGEQLSLFDY